MEVDGLIKEQKIRDNNLYCITVKSGQEHLESEFEKDCLSYMEEFDGEYIAGFDVDDESIYFTFMDEWKIEKMVDFFKRNKILIEVEKVSNIIKFINSDKKYLKVYSEERNRVIMNHYITIHITIDSILERLFENKEKDDFFLLPIEKEILLMT